MKESMKESKIFREDNEHCLAYLLEGESSYMKQKALAALEKAKKYEATREYFHVYEDEKTYRLVDKQKVLNAKIELVRVVLRCGRLVWMTKKNALKKGYINE